MRRRRVERASRDLRAELPRRDARISSLHLQSSERGMVRRIKRIERANQFVHRDQALGIVAAGLLELLRQQPRGIQIGVRVFQQGLELADGSRPIVALQRDLRHQRVRAPGAGGNRHQLRGTLERAIRFLYLPRLPQILSEHHLREIAVGMRLRDRRHVHVRRTKLFHGRHRLHNRGVFLAEQLVERCLQRVDADAQAGFERGFPFFAFAIGDEQLTKGGPAIGVDDELGEQRGFVIGERDLFGIGEGCVQLAQRHDVALAVRGGERQLAFPSPVGSAELFFVHRDAFGEPPRHALPGELQRDHVAELVPERRLPVEVARRPRFR